MTPATVRHAATHVGEFAVGAAVAYAVVGAVWVVTAAVWAPIIVAAALVAVAWGLEARWAGRFTGLVVGMFATAVALTGLLTAFSLVLSRLH